MAGRRALASIAVAVLTSGILVSAPAVAATDPTTCSTAGGDDTAAQDVNGDFRPDPVEGVPNATVGSAPSAGVVVVHDFCGATGPAPQRLSESSFTGLPAAAAGDRFGAAVSYTRLASSDPYTSLVIGAPGAGGGTGVVVLALGSQNGIQSDGAIRLVGRSAGERFGSAIVAAGGDVWIGAPGRTVSNHSAAGAIDHYRITGSTATLVETLTEDTSGIPGLAEANDHFGSVLAIDRSDVVVGEPNEDVGSAADAGTVTAIRYGSGGTQGGGRSSAIAFSQNSTGISGGSEAGDRFGAAVSVDAWGSSSSIVAVGVPGEDVGSIRDAGMVHLVVVPPTGAPTQRAALSQESATIPGGSEAGDQFGGAVQLGDFDGQLVPLPDPPGDEAGIEDVAIGAPGEDLGTVADAGDVIVVQLSATIHAVGPVLRQGGGGSADLGGSAHAGDRVGATLAPLARPPLGETSGGATLLVGVPGEDVGGIADAGATGTGYRTGGFYYDTAGPVANERYGSVAPTALPNGPMRVLGPGA